MENQRLMTIDEAAEYLSLSKKCLYRYSSERKLPVIKISSRAIRFRKIDLDQFIEDHISQPAAG